MDSSAGSSNAGWRPRTSAAAGATAAVGTASYRPDIDGLRAIAILGVVAYHARIPGFSGGFLGVDVFFVISGFLITQLLHRELRETRRISLSGFYARRARRILPALLTVMTVTLLLCRFLLPPAEREECIDSAWSALLFVANHFFWAATGSYFDGVSELMPLLHLWSLAVEEQFYLVWPLLLYVAVRTARGPRWTGMWVALIAAASLVFSVWLKRSDASAAFFFAPSRGWELCAGALLALWPPHHALPRKFAGWMSWCGAGLIAVAYMWTDPAAGFQLKAVVWAVAGAALLIHGNQAAPGNAIRSLLASRPLVAIGLVSYSWYLWHWPVLALLRNATLRADTLWQDIAAIVFALGLAALTTACIENPIRFGAGSLLRDPWRVLRWAGVSLAAVAIVATGMTWLENHGPSTARERLSWAVADDVPEDKAYECIVVREAWQGELPVEECRYGDEAQPVRVALWGDSHALAWLPMLQALQRDGAPRFVQLTVTGCQPLASDFLPRSAKNALCAEFGRVALQHLLELKAQGLTTVVLAGRWSQQRAVRFSRYESDPVYPSMRTLIASLAEGSLATAAERPAANAADPLRDGLRAVLRTLQSAGFKTLVLLDPPEFRYPLYSCLYYRFERPNDCGVSRAEYERSFGELRATIQAAAAPFASVRVIDPLEEFCTTELCPPFWRDKPVTWDDNHLSASAARAFAPIAEPAFRWALH